MEQTLEPCEGSDKAPVSSIEMLDAIGVGIGRKSPTPEKIGHCCSEVVIADCKTTHYLCTDA